MKPYKTNIIMNGHTLEVEIAFEVYDELQYGSSQEIYEMAYDPSVEGSFENFQSRLEKCDLFLGSVLVTATCKELSIEGSDILGMNELSCNNMFNSKPYEQSVMRIVKDNNMVEEAIANLIISIKTSAVELEHKAKLFKKYTKKTG